MLCHPADKLAGAFISCAHATVVWKQWKTQSTAIAPQHEYAHVSGSGPVGQTDTPLPSLGVSSLDLGRSHIERPLLCEDGNLPSHDRKCSPDQRLARRGRGFCNAQESPCVLCAAHLDFPYEVGEFLADFVALLGRFLPRLGPHGSPRGPFYFAALQGLGSTA